MPENRQTQLGQTNEEPPVPPRKDPADAIRLLRSLCDGDPDEQRETWEFLRQALDEDRLSDRKLFP